MKRLEIRDSKGKALESLPNTVETDGVTRVKELKASNPKQDYQLVVVSTLYDTANPPVEIDF